MQPCLLALDIHMQPCLLALDIHMQLCLLALDIHMQLCLLALERSLRCNALHCCEDSLKTELCLQGPGGEQLYFRGRAPGIEKPLRHIKGTRTHELEARSNQGPARVDRKHCRRATPRCGDGQRAAQGVLRCADSHACLCYRNLQQNVAPALETILAIHFCVTHRHGSRPHCPTTIHRWRPLWASCRY
eukprot:SAG31_NODE_810_length_11919_cov_4.480924_1_plen_188_part_00